ncbi:hypothetical protein ARMGADRAFT_1019743 [Armillaria gallica]|uniref:Uncharacterized protein n=1 Tax=Armillaria gallica TaxID=47427 RepID=A0A2H3CSY7_ARMGA|nr:hypothetical protein ARMGADRAFT_1019743 [Armillaria gallica]
MPPSYLPLNAPVRPRCSHTSSTSPIPIPAALSVSHRNATPNRMVHHFLRRGITTIFDTNQKPNRDLFSFDGGAYPLTGPSP